MYSVDIRLFWYSCSDLHIVNPQLNISVDCLCFCVQGQFVIAGCSEGVLHVWNWETSTEIGHIAAHKQRIHHCSLLPNTGELSGKWVLTSCDPLCLPLSLCMILHSIIRAQTLVWHFMFPFWNSCIVFKTKTKKSTQRKWLFSLRLMTAQCSSGNHYRSAG